MPPVGGARNRRDRVPSAIVEGDAVPAAPSDLDTKYVPFPDFSEWVGYEVDVRSWEAEKAKLDAYRTESAEFFDRARQAVTKAAAIETGAIEDLYTHDRGLTITVAVEAAAWQEAVAKAGEKKRGLLEGQLRAYGTVLDFATKQRPIAQAWIRQLHGELCAGQDTYSVFTVQGQQEHALEKGAYKSQPNHVFRPADETWHFYAPVLDVLPEMQRLCETLESDSFRSAHPTLQTAYAHYALVRIHPFADGNGRVARALASVFTVRAASVPLLITLQDKNEYVDALEAADAGNGQRFVDFIGRRVLDSMRIAETSFRAARLDPSEPLERIEKLYFTRSGFGIERLDQAALDLGRAFHDALKKQAGEHVNRPSVRFEFSLPSNIAPGVVTPHYRLPVGVHANIEVVAATVGPVGASEVYHWHVEIPSDPTLEDELRVVPNSRPGRPIGIRVKEVLPALTITAEILLELEARQTITEILVGLVEKTATALGQKGYR